MTPLLNLSQVHALTCSRLNCDGRPIQRHHRGCEGMWLTHFRHRKRTAKWRAFRERYYEYRTEDCAALCKECHREIHVIYYRIIGIWARELGPCRTWTWKQANLLMENLREVFAKWIVTSPVSQ